MNMVLKRLLFNFITLVARPKELIETSNLEVCQTIGNDIHFCIVEIRHGQLLKLVNIAIFCISHHRLRAKSMLLETDTIARLTRLLRYIVVF